MAQENELLLTKENIESVLLDCIAQLSGLRCSYKTTQIGYIETTKVINRAQQTLNALKESKNLSIIN